MARTTTRTRSRPATPDDQDGRAVPPTKFTRIGIIAAPALPPEVLPAPRGDLRRAGFDELFEAVTATWDDWKAQSRIRGLRVLLRYVERFGEPEDQGSWQQRWEASGLNGRGRPVRDLADRVYLRAAAVQALEALLCLRVIRPSLEAFRSNRFTDYPAAFRVAQADPRLDAFFAAVESSGKVRHWQRRATFDVCCALTVQGIAFADLTPEAFLHHARVTREAGLAAYSYQVYVGHLAWQVMHATGHFPPRTPGTLRAALRCGRLTPAELVDQYQVRNVGIRDLLVAYLERRSHDLDYGTLSALATILVLNFWRKIEELNPGQADLRIAPEVYQQWRAALHYRRDGKPRLNQDSVLMAVRALYHDLQAWAAEQPERWATWVAPCPIRAIELRASAQRRRRTSERMADRTRRRQPLLPKLVDYVDAKRQHLAELLAAASTADRDQVLTVGSGVYRRLFTPGDQSRVRLHGQANVRVRDERTGAVINVTQTEDAAFWDWAIIETLRHSGVRIEELLELSQLSIRQYQRSNGEVIALLVIAPSKTDRERVIPMSPELFHVIACIVRRLVRDRPAVPLATRYDKGERITSTPQPFLFQRHIGQRTEVMTEGAVGMRLRRLGLEVAAEHPQFASELFTPHDFRRLFATELVNSGLPIHIGATLLGHLDLQTTRGYVAVFDEEVVRHYQAHLARRRAVRSKDEYRPATEDEWAEFEQHFDKRKVELGNCGRPYGTPCQHEHACVRCPMLFIDPKMLPRLEELDRDLVARRERAEAEGWLGEIEGIDLTLTFLRDKHRQAQRLRALPIRLGSPSSIGGQR